MSKLYPCEICNREVGIRSTIKRGEYKDKKVCPVCKSRHEVLLPLPQKSTYPLTYEQAYNPREGYAEFFQEAIEELKKNPVCQNCGERISVSYEPVRNIAHILPKQRYKSVAIHPDNKLFLCSSKDFQNSCHEKFDSGVSTMVKMPCFKLAVEKFEKFKDQVTENGKLFHILAENNSV